MKDRKAHGASEVIVLKEYVKTILYVYPLIREMEKEYQKHIENKAVLSYREQGSVESQVEYLAKEITDKRNLLWLQSCVERVLETLSDSERTLIAVRYFGKTKAIKKAVVAHAKRQTVQKHGMSERTYFRLQNKLLCKVAEVLVGMGLDKMTFDKLFAKLPLFEQVSLLQARREYKLTENERHWFGCT